ncbi:hypothetical protein CR513_26430, partial [Mucuna pruriens]
MYVMTCTRLNVAYVVRRLSRYTSNPMLVEVLYLGSFINVTLIEDHSLMSGCQFGQNQWYRYPSIVIVNQYYERHIIKYMMKSPNPLDLYITM